MNIHCPWRIILAKAECLNVSRCETLLYPFRHRPHPPRFGTSFIKERLTSQSSREAIPQFPLLARQTSHLLTDYTSYEFRILKVTGKYSLPDFFRGSALTSKLTLQNPGAAESEISDSRPQRLSGSKDLSRTVNKCGNNSY